jgi:1-hydroxycarotenoid 3,4-desaturase
VRNRRVAIIGAGIGGLTAAVDLAAAGFEVIVLERASYPGGKVRTAIVADQSIDAGPTVFTLPGIFDALFDDAGDDFRRRVTLQPAALLARHAWRPTGTLDLYPDVEKTTAAIGDFAGQRDAHGYLQFAAQARRIFRTLDRTFMKAARPTPFELMQRVGSGHLADMWNIQPFVTLWRSTARYFRDPRLRQMFARYATYCGSSPFAAPATLMLISHVEQSGVWYIDGGMSRLPMELAALAERKGATIRYDSCVRAINVNGGRVTGIDLLNGEQMAVDAVVSNADNSALAAGLFGEPARSAVRAIAPATRSLSAVTWNLLAQVDGFVLAHHSVFFGDDYRAEFSDIFRHRRLPASPTVYICAQDRRDATLPGGRQAERLLCLINAPPTGDTHFFEPAEIDACKERIFERLRQMGMKISSPQQACVTTNPSDFNWLFPATGGALYGPASHGWMSSFKRAGSRSLIRGLYLAGGSTHPGPGIPMTAISGRLAAAAIIADCVSTARSNPAVMHGGMSMR